MCVGFLVLCTLLFSWPQGLSENRVLHCQTDKPLGCTASGTMNCPKGAVSTCKGSQRKWYFNISFLTLQTCLTQGTSCFPSYWCFLLDVYLVFWLSKCCSGQQPQAGFKSVELREAHSWWATLQNRLQSPPMSLGCSLACHGHHSTNSYSRHTAAIFTYVYTLHDTWTLISPLSFHVCMLSLL